MRTQFQFFTGDRVVFGEEYSAKYPGVYRVERVNPRTLSLRGEDGGKVKADPFLVEPTDKPFEPLAPEKTFHLGDTVKFASHARVNPDELSKVFVIIKHGSSPGTFNLAELNGGSDRYFRSINTGVLEKVEITL